MSEVTEGQAPTEPAQDAPPAESSTAEHPAPGGDARTGVDSSESSDAEAKPKREGGFQRRINELTSRVRQAEEKEQRLLGLVDKLTSQPDGAAGDADDSPPQRDSFDDYEAYLEARADYRVQQAVAEQQKSFEAKQAEQQQQQRQSELQSRWSEQMRKGQAAHDDFDVIARNDALPVTQTMAETIMESEEGAEVLYFLGSNPDEAARIAELSGLQQALALGRIEERLSAERAQATQRRSAAPDPVEPVNAGPAAPSNALSDKSNIDDWMKARNAQLYG